MRGVLLRGCVVAGVVVERQCCSKRSVGEREGVVLRWRECCCEGVLS